MENRWEIVFAGVGGQGLITVASALGEAAAIHQGKNAALTSSYGVETRGTFTKSDIIISDAEIDFPEALQPDAVVALSDAAYKKYAEELDENAILIYDCKEASPLASKARQYPFPITAMAIDAGGKACANFVSLGLLLGLLKLIDPSAVEKAIEERYRKNERALKMNSGAFRLGLLSSAGQ